MKKIMLFASLLSLMQTSSAMEQGKPRFRLDESRYTNHSRQKKQIKMAKAIEADNVELVQHLIAKGFDIHTEHLIVKSGFLSNIGPFPLHHAIGSGAINVIKYLLEIRFDVNEKNIANLTPLVLAACYAPSETLNETYTLLIDRGAKLSIGDKRKATPLHALMFRYFNSFNFSGCNKVRDDIICVIETLLDKQTKINNSVITGLLCIRKMAQEGSRGCQLLYKEREKLLYPLIGFANYAPIYKLLELKDANGKQPYDIYPLECLNPRNAPDYVTDEDSNQSRCIMQ